jgi:glycosyltransferase involved in cell wall biosynthesis
MRVTHVAIVHKPLDTRIYEKQCRTLADAGYEVHLVAPAAPSETVDGVRFHSIAESAVRPRARRQPSRLLRASIRALRLRPSIYHLHEPHLIPLGLLLRAVGERVVYDVHEDYPAHARSKLFGHPLRGRVKASMWAGLELIARQSFDGFVCASPALADRFPGATVAGNFPLHRHASANGARPYRERPNTLVYTGNIGTIRGFWEMARALELLPGDLDCRLRLIGDWRPAELEAAARRLEVWDRIELAPWLRLERVVGELRGVKVGLILLHPLPNHQDAIRSNKLFEYMAAGIPVVASDLPRWREIVCGVGCGVVVDPRDPAAIAAAIERLLRDPDAAEAMGERGRAAVRSTFNWGQEAARLLSLYRDLDAGEPAGVPGAGVVVA